MVSGVRGQNGQTGWGPWKGDGERNSSSIYHSAVRTIRSHLHISALSNQQRFSSTTFLAWDNRDVRFLNTGQFSFNVSR